MKVRYRLQAHCVLRDDRIKSYDYRGVAKCSKGANMLGDEQLLVVMQNFINVPDKPITIEMTTNVRHGISGMKTSHFKFNLNKSDYYFGEIIKMQVDCDNTESQIGVKSIKFKLYLCYIQRHDSRVT